jgi:hypothetical protein
MRRYVRKPPRRIIIEPVPTTAFTCIAAMLPDPDADAARHTRRIRSRSIASRACRTLASKGWSRSACSIWRSIE